MTPLDATALRAALAHMTQAAEHHAELAEALQRQLDEARWALAAARADLTATRRLLARARNDAEETARPGGR